MAGGRGPTPGWAGFLWDPGGAAMAERPTGNGAVQGPKVWDQVAKVLELQLQHQSF